MAYRAETHSIKRACDVRREEGQVCSKTHQQLVRLDAENYSRQTALRTEKPQRARGKKFINYAIQLIQHPSFGARSRQGKEKL